MSDALESRNLGTVPPKRPGYDACHGAIRGAKISQRSRNAYFWSAGSWRRSCSSSPPELARRRKLCTGNIGNKEELFAEIIRRRSARLTGGQDGELDMNGTPREVLGRLGLNLLDFLTLADSLSFCRIMVAEAVRAPELGRIFFRAKSGPRSLRVLALPWPRRPPRELALPRTRACRQTLSRSDCLQLPVSWARRARL